MVMVNTQISLLINLACEDGEIDEKERELIYTIGRSHGLESNEIDALIDHPDRNLDFDTLEDEERFECLYNLVHLMKVDGQIFDEEISYCLEMARKLKYPLEAVMELYGLVHANVRLTKEINTIKKKYRNVKTAGKRP